MLYGQDYKHIDADFTKGEVTAKMEGFFYEDNMYFTFSDPKDSARAAVQGL